MAMKTYKVLENLAGIRRKSVYHRTMAENVSASKSASMF